MISAIDHLQNHANSASAPLAPGSGSPGSGSPGSGSTADGFRIVFSQVNANGSSPAKPPAPAPAVASPFEQNVHTALIGGADVPNNSLQFATADAADVLAKKLGGKVQEVSLSGKFSRSAPERMIVGAGVNPINAGLALDLFARYGDAPGSEAWRVINQDLGRG